MKNKSKEETEMKLLEYKQFNNSDEEKSLNKKKVSVAVIILLIVLIIVITFIAYISSPNVRDFMDKYILFKNVNENDLAYIYICILQLCCCFTK